MMKGNNNNKRKSAPRRRRNNNGSTVARNQTKYHRQYVGFETTFTMGSNTGYAVPIAPGNYNPSGSIPTTAYSQFFVTRFSPCWKAWRMLGWKCTMIVTNKDNAQGSGIVAAVPFNQSLSLATGPIPAISFVTPSFITQLCELPNVKMLSIDSANSKNRAGFSYFQGRRDINSLPFQFIGEDKPDSYVTGLQMYYEAAPGDTTVVVRMFGNMLIEFKDPAYYIPRGFPEANTIDDSDQQEQDQERTVPYVKRLQRINLE